MIDLGSEVNLLTEKKKKNVSVKGIPRGLSPTTYLGRLEWIVSREMN